MGDRLGLPRSVRRAAARLLVVALSVTTFSPVLHDEHDTDCVPLVVLHDASAHQVRGAAAPPQPAAESDHCVACHFARSSRGPVSWELTGLVALDRTLGLLAADDRHHVRLTATPRPARAPPLV